VLASGLMRGLIRSGFPNRTRRGMSSAMGHAYHARTGLPYRRPRGPPPRSTDAQYRPQGQCPARSPGTNFGSWRGIGSPRGVAAGRARRAVMWRPSAGTMSWTGCGKPWTGPWPGAGSWCCSPERRASARRPCSGRPPGTPRAPAPALRGDGAGRARARPGTGLGYRCCGRSASMPGCPVTCWGRPRRTRPRRPVSSCSTR
jgi:hypothetical protein